MTLISGTTITPLQAYEWLKTGQALLVDVREPDEFKSEHIAYALSLPLANVCDIPQHLHLAPDYKVIFQCLRGTRGARACEMLPKGGIACATYNMAGGIEAWKQAGLPVVSAAVLPSIPISRQVQMIVGLLVLACILLGFSGFTIGFVLAGAFGAALAFAGITGWCGLAIALSKAPWNKR